MKLTCTKIIVFHLLCRFVGVWPRLGRIRPRTKRAVVEYTGDISVLTGTMLPPELICNWVFS